MWVLATKWLRSVHGSSPSFKTGDGPALRVSDIALERNYGGNPPNLYGIDRIVLYVSRSFSMSTSVAAKLKPPDNECGKGEGDSKDSEDDVLRLVVGLSFITSRR